MKDRRSCKIIQDLLPNYIEGLTNQETNQFIEDHLNECNECKKMYTDMKQKLSEEGKENNKEKVDYLKKYNKRIYLLRKIIFLIIALFVILYSVSVIRKMIIISDINKKISNYSKINNYYAKATQYGGDVMRIMEKYSKDNRCYIKTTFISSDKNKNWIIRDYKNGEQINSYYENEQQKNANMNVNSMVEYNVFGTWYERFLIYNNLGLLRIAILSDISTEKCNGKECFKITQHMLGSDFELVNYVEKNTGLPIRNIFRTTINEWSGDGVIDYEYDIENVEDSIFVEPNIEEYKE